MSENEAVRARLLARLDPRSQWVDVPDEWLPHLGVLDAAIAAIDPAYELIAVKEKFGGLRYYLRRVERSSADAEQIRAIVAAAEADSYSWGPPT